MVIKRSAGQEVQGLIAELRADDEVRREAAVARLAVIGTRAVDRLLALLGEPAAATAHVAAMRALESIGDARALGPAVALLDSPDPDVAVAAVSVLRGLLPSRHGSEVFERLVAAALDPGRPEAARLAALDAIREMGTKSLAPVWDRLKDDPSLAVRRRAARETGEADPLSELEAAAAGVLPSDAATLSAWLAEAGAESPLTTLHRVLQAVLARETEERSPAARDEWRAARGAIHLAVARRESRVTLYDLRETIAGSAAPLPASFIAAVAAVGDATALESIAAAFAASVSAHGETPGERGARMGAPVEGPEEAASGWRDSLADAFRLVAEREGIGRRHAIVKRIEAKWPQAAELLSTLSRNTRGSSRPSRT